MRAWRRANLETGGQDVNYRPLVGNVQEYRIIYEEGGEAIRGGRKRDSD